MLLFSYHHFWFRKLTEGPAWYRISLNVSSCEKETMAKTDLEPYSQEILKGCRLSDALLSQKWQKLWPPAQLRFKEFIRDN
jgi:hypothetical protein